MDPPQPNDFLKMIWPILTEQQKQLIIAYMTPMMGGKNDTIPATQPGAGGNSSSGT